MPDVTVPGRLAAPPEPAPRRRRLRRAPRHTGPGTGLRLLAMAAACGLAALGLLQAHPIDAAFSGTTGNGANSLALGSLSAPSPLSCAWTGTNSLALTWTNNSASATGYTVERSDSLASGYATLATVTPASTVTTTDSNPLPPTLRYYRVNAYLSAWTSASTAASASNTCDLTIDTFATINDPTGLAFDGSGNLYVTSSADNKVYKVTTGGVVSTFAGTGVAGYSGNGGAATSAQLNQPKDASIDGSGNVYWAEAGNHMIRKVTPGGTISTVAGSTFLGSPSSGYSGDGGAATSAKLDSPYGLYVASDGTMYIADSGNDVIRKVTSGGTISTVAGSSFLGVGQAGYSGDGGAATSAKLNFPYDVIFDSSGNWYIADNGNNVIRKVTSGGTISTYAGGGFNTACSFSGAATSLSMSGPKRMAWDPATSRLFSPDNGRNCVRAFTGSNVAQVAGTGTAGSTGDDGPAVAATINAPNAVGLSSAGDLYIADSGGYVRKVLQV